VLVSRRIALEKRAPGRGRDTMIKAINEVIEELRIGGGPTDPM
jgi:hypothetical protein